MKASNPRTSRKRIQTLVSGLILLILPVILSACGGGKEGETNGPPLPIYYTQAFGTTSGQTLKLETHKDRVILLNVWSSACQTCQKSSALFKEITKDLGEKFLLLGLNVDQESSPDAVGKKAKKLGHSYNSMLDPDSIIGKNLLLREPPMLLIMYVGQNFRAYTLDLNEASKEKIVGLIEKLKKNYNKSGTAGK